MLQTIALSEPEVSGHDHLESQIPLRSLRARSLVAEEPSSKTIHRLAEAIRGIS